MKLQRPTSRTLILVGVISIVVGALLIEIIAIAKRWEGLAREISFLVAFPALPLPIMAAFPHAARHIRTALYVLGCVIGLVVVAAYTGDIAADFADCVVELVFAAA